MAELRDPRTIVTPHAFRVAPELLGRPLARPWRRGAALLVDLMLVAILVALLQEPGIFFGLVGAILLFRSTARSADAGWMRRTLRFSGRAFGALLLFVGITAGWDAVAGRGGDDGVEVRYDEAGVSVNLSLPQAVMTGTDLAALRNAKTPEEAKVAAERLVRRLEDRRLGPDALAEISQALDELDPEAAQTVGLAPSALTALRDAVHSRADLYPAEPAPRAQRPRPDSLARAYAAAVAAGDSATAEELASRLATVLAADTLAGLEGRIARLERQNEGLQHALADDGDGPGILAYLRRIADDLGLGFGWTGLYFTAFLALWRGQTPGKRLFGLRVVLLNGKPLGWWVAFSRFGGYAAALSTGLLGFLQILWDPNRQGIHDKITQTVVVRERPGPADRALPAQGE